ncbi:MAG: glycosyltransferase [Clostridia bacterium]|nr:glycosyltransferase [Clostridia bacterium]
MEILIVSPPLFAGGISSSLLSLLHSLDYEKYNVDLMLMRSEGEFIDMLPKDVHLLEPALDEKNYYIAKAKKFFIYSIKGYLVRRLLYGATRGRRYKNGDFQLMAGLARCSAARKINKIYDVAIGYMEGFENAYVAIKVRAKRKIGYIHVDYEKAGLDKSLDTKIFSRLDDIVLVSESNKAVFDALFPEYRHKTHVVENIVCKELIEKMSEEAIYDFTPDTRYFNIVTAARLKISHKGLDRGIAALKRLKEEGYKIKWYVFGDGDDREKLEALIWENGLCEDFILMGGRKNVYPYIKRGDVFVLPSRYEGKPIAVSEAQVLGVVPLVTEYSSAREQICDGIDGLVVENSVDGIFNGIKRMVEEDKLLPRLKRNLLNKKLDISCGLRQFYEVVGGQ